MNEVATAMLGLRQGCMMHQHSALRYRCNVQGARSTMSAHDTSRGHQRHLVQHGGALTPVHGRRASDSGYPVQQHQQQLDTQWEKQPQPGMVFRAWREHARGVRVLAQVKLMLQREQRKSQAHAEAAAQQRHALLECLASSQLRSRDKLLALAALGRCIHGFPTCVQQHW